MPLMLGVLIKLWRVHMNVKNPHIEAFLKGRVFGYVLALLCCFFAYRRILLLTSSFSYFELGHLIFNLMLAFLFITRTKASVVSMNPFHWIVALATSFSGFFFIKAEMTPQEWQIAVTQILTIGALVLEVPAVLTLGRSFGFLPALRCVKTNSIYKVLRHPMYLGCILVRLTYCIRNPIGPNFMLFAVVVLLYGLRTKHEEEMLSHDVTYIEYMQRVRYRLCPGIF